MYTDKLIRLHTKALDYLSLIANTDDRASYKKAILKEYDASNNVYDSVRLMYNRNDLCDSIIRYTTLSYWLQKRLINTQSQINAEMQKRTIETISTNEVN